MVNKQRIQELLQEALCERPDAGLFPVSVSISPKSEIKIYIDGMQGVNIDDCVEVSRYIESKLNRDEEDFELTVSSAGLDQPLRIPAQYKKNKGKEVKVVTAGGENLKGIIEDADEDGFLLKVSPSKKKGKKAPEGEAVSRSFPYAEVKETKVVISFK